jgi:hypothetical protein
MIGRVKCNLLLLLVYKKLRSCIVCHCRFHGQQREIAVAHVFELLFHLKRSDISRASSDRSNERSRERERCYGSGTWAMSLSASEMLAGDPSFKYAFITSSYDSRFGLAPDVSNCAIVRKVVALFVLNFTSYLCNSLKYVCVCVCALGRQSTSSRSGTAAGPTILKCTTAAGSRSFAAK